MVTKLLPKTGVDVTWTDPLARGRRNQAILLWIPVAAKVAKLKIYFLVYQKPGAGLHNR